MIETREILKNAVSAKPSLASLNAEQINTALLAIADELESEESIRAILDANATDMEKARHTVSDVMLDRLRLDAGRIRGMANGIREVAALPSPLGKVISETVRPNGMTVRKVSVSLGVLAIIYESRPNVTSDAAALALKSGNVCVLRGGKESYNSSAEIVKAIRRGLVRTGITQYAVNLIEDTSRQSALELMRANGFVDVLIPRGGKGLISSCIENATVPCIQTGTGICHVYVDRDADLEKAINIIENAKTQRPSVCNAAEVLLVHRDVAPVFLPMVKQRLADGRAADGKTPVEFRCDGASIEYLDGIPAGAEDFDTEFLDYILAVRVVESVGEAIEHIRAHSTAHSEAIVTENAEAQALFCQGVDSAAVYVNVSTRFTDGGEFGFGCEMGISTQKLHARGPMGLAELTTYKYIITGNGQTR